MPRRPPQRKATDVRGPRPTDKLPDAQDARRTWTGPPYERSPGRWSGAIDFQKQKHHVGTFETPYQWGVARDRLLLALREQPAGAAAPDHPGTELDGVTVKEFVGPDGTGWPWRFDGRRGRRRERSTFAHHEQCIRAFVAAFGDRPLKGGIKRLEANDWCQSATENQITSAIAMFNDAGHIDDSVVSPLKGMSRERTRGRKDLPDVLTVEEVELLQRIARRTHPGEYGAVLETMIEVMATCAPRPGELWAAERKRVDRGNHELRIQYAVKKGGRLGPPKYNQTRSIVLAPRAFEMVMALPVINDRFLFPSKRGRLMTQSLWTTYWHPLRDAFTAVLDDDHWLVRRIADCAAAKEAELNPAKRRRMPDGKLDFYELRHRACTYMATPQPHGLGLAAADIALQIGHRDGGRLVEEVYIHRSPELARERIAHAMGYRQTPPSAQAPGSAGARSARRRGFRT